MFRHALQMIAVIAAIGIIYVFTLGPVHFDAMTNKVVRDLPLPAVGVEAAALHETLFIADLHADPLLWRRDLSRRHDHGICRACWRAMSACRFSVRSRKLPPTRTTTQTPRTAIF